ncbi:alpha-L-fucosidase [Undibacterium sp. Ji67W]
MKHKLALLFLLGMSSFTNPVVAGSVVSTDWFKNAGYGVGVHWTSQSMQSNGGAPLSYCTAVNNFNVNNFVNQLQAAGAAYVLFTISHAQWYFAFPNATLDSIIPGRTCGRDLYAELGAALAAKNIKMMFYFPSNGDASDPNWIAASQWNTNRAAFVQNMYNLVQSIGNKYGTMLAGWWVDNNYYQDLGTYYDHRVYAKMLRAGNPDRLVTFNFGGTQNWGSTLGKGNSDYQAGEAQALYHLPTSRYSGEGATQWHTWSPLDAPSWVDLSVTPPVPRYSDNKVILYTKAVMNEQGVMTWNIAAVQDTLISAASLAQLSNINNAVRKSGVSTVIDDTHPAISYSGGWLPWSYEYAHLQTTTYSTTSGSTATFSFVGTDVNIYGPTGTDHGRADVYVDGLLDKTIDLNATTRNNVAMIYSKTGLSLGLHNVKIVARSDSSNSGHYVEIDAISFASKADDTLLNYSSGWFNSIIPGAYKGAVSRTVTPGATVTYSFTGTAIDWFGMTAPDHGFADVYIDNVFKATVDTYSPTTNTQALIYELTGLADGPHNLTIKARGDKNPASSNSYIDIDFLQYASSSSAVPTSTVDDATVGKGLVFNGPWLTSNSSTYSGGSTHYLNLSTASTGSYAQYTFNGTECLFYGVTGPDHGMMSVYVDGTFNSTVDLYRVTRQNQARMFSINGLTPGTHTVTIYPGAKNALSTNYLVDVDFVQSR